MAPRPAGRLGRLSLSGFVSGFLRPPAAFRLPPMSLASLLDPHRRWMRLALAEAQRAGEAGDVPIGAVVVRGDTVVGRGHNQVERLADPTAHAEMLAVSAACQTLGTKFLDGCTLYVTLEPCPMCAQAISFARLRRLYYGAADPKGGGVEHGPRIFASSSCHHAPEVYGGIGERPATALLKAFFAARRDR